MRGLSFIILISTLIIVHGRPQNSGNLNPTVETEKQTMVEIKGTTEPANQKSQIIIEADTKQILDKIAEVNKLHGLTPRKQKPNFFHFPFSYSRSPGQVYQDRQRSDFKFPNNPFVNPIFEYLEREKHKEENNYPARYDTRQALGYNDQNSFGVSMINPNAEVTEEDKIPGQYIKRKIVHQQTLLIPNPSMMTPTPMSMYPASSFPNAGSPYSQNVPNLIPVYPSDREQANYSNDSKVMNNLEKQTIEHVRNIVSNSQLSQQLSSNYQYQMTNPYQYSSDNFANQPQYAYLNPSGNNLGQTNQNGDVPYGYQLYGPYSVPTPPKSRQNWNWPGATYFPILIRDPFVQLYNAVTSMIEYGPAAGQNNPCPGRPSKSEGQNKNLIREGKTSEGADDSTQIDVELIDDAIPEDSEENLEDKNVSTYLDIENVDVGTGKDNTLKFTVNLKRNDRESKINGQDRTKSFTNAPSSSDSTSRSNSKVSDTTLKDLRPHSMYKPTPHRQEPIISPPRRDPTRQTVEFGEEEQEKSEGIISNDGNKKLFSRDNTGSGVFIHRLKVRKGGVAIAGPGGIATAGSGGTAIVGPNGVAYTHPDSLAIAGSGTKVVAVDPTINLGDLISNNTKGNKSKTDTPTRIGKVVAVGPVVYYNKG